MEDEDGTKLHLVVGALFCLRLARAEANNLPDANGARHLPAMWAHRRCACARATGQAATGKAVASGWRMGR